MKADLGAFAGLDSPIHRAAPGLKLGGALALIVGVMLVPPTHAGWLGVPAVLVVGTLWASHLPIRFFVRRVLALEPLVLGVALLAWLQPGGAPVAALVMARSTLGLATAVLLAATTPFVRLLEVLRRLKVPPLLLTVVTLMSRYVYVLSDEAGRLDRARRSRSFVRARRFDWGNLAALVGHLFLRATNRAERIYAAMCARGWR